MAVIRKTVSLSDPDYFCNKSWTLSFNMNTKSWISFHSYIPNWYIAENNFFYSGVNGCCADFDFIVGELVANPITTTTTTSLTTSTTTSSTTMIPLDCIINGNVIETYCDLSGIAIITIDSTPPVCERPNNLNLFNLITGYTIPSVPTIVVSSASQVDACNAVSYINSLEDNLSDIEMTYIPVNSNNLSLGETIYVFNGSMDCVTIADGWYFTEESLYYNIIYNVVSGTIVEVYNCNPSYPITTTTTSTTSITTTLYVPCLSYIASTDSTSDITVIFTDCNNVESMFVIGGSTGILSKAFCAYSIISDGGAVINLNGLC